jgi:hypothetical protein
MKQFQFWVVVAFLSTLASFKMPVADDFDAIEKGFLSPPDSIRISTFYYWVNNHISKEGVIKDLNAMKKAGITRVFIGTDIRNRTSWSRDLTGQYFGSIKVFSEEWWDILHIALKTAADLDIEVGLFNCPGWSQSGGPWVKPQQAMRYLDASEIRVKGPGKIFQLLPKTDTFFQDVKVLAMRVPPGYQQNLLELPGTKLHPSNLQIIPSPKTSQAKYILSRKESMLDIDLPEETTVRSLTFYPAEYLNATVDVWVKVDTGYRSIQKVEISRARTVEDLAKGFEPHAPYFLPLSEVKGKSFRLVFQKNGELNSQLSNIVMSASPVIRNLAEKKLAKVVGASPSWTNSRNKLGAGVSKQVDLPNTKDVLDISQYMSKDGLLNWNAPKGEWIIMRTGMRFINVQNGPASLEAEGLEVDKLSKTHVVSHFNAFIGQILKRIPANDRSSFKMVIMDSYERGGMNFTDGFLADFKNRYGYDATPYLPVYSGHLIGSAEMSDRFLWDMRRMIADKLSYDYVGGFREESHKHGLKTWLENYGHSGYPGEFLQYGGQSDEVAGEYWVEPINNERRFENRGAASTAHIYGKNKAWAESFTSGSWTSNPGFATYPKELKRLGDWAFTEGINSTVLHLYIQQPYENDYPGIDAWFGTEFNRKNTWFNHMDLFTAYHKRCNFMLQQGSNVADIAYYIGEDNPIMRGAQEPKLPKGYNYDYINAEVIIRDMKVKDGKLVLPHGASYRILVLPRQETMRPEVLQKIEQLVAQGAVVLGAPPSRSPSLQGYPHADEKVQVLAKKMWGDANAKQRAYGKGIIFSSISLDEALRMLNVAPDCLPGNEPVAFTHRTLNSKEIYFLSNVSNKPVEFKAIFRVKGLQPELWDALIGTTRLLPAFGQSAESTEVPLKLAVDGSAFIVFRKNGSPQGNDIIDNFPKPTVIATIHDPWQVSFEHDRIKRGPVEPIVMKELKDWTQSDDERIRYYSGAAIYTSSLMIDKVPISKTLYLDLGDLTATAKVKVNGTYVGGVWTSPNRVNVSGIIHTGKNTLEIEVINTWKNRLIGDHRLPEKDRIVQSKSNQWNAQTPLQKSGLFGPVTLLAEGN